MVLDVALTVPACIVVEMLVDRVGPRKNLGGSSFWGPLVYLGVARANEFAQPATFRFPEVA